MCLSSGNATEPHHEQDLSDTVVLRGGFSGVFVWKGDTKDSRCTLAVFSLPFVTLARTSREVLSRSNNARLQCLCCLLIQVYCHYITKACVFMMIFFGNTTLWVLSDG